MRLPPEPSLTDLVDTERHPILPGAAARDDLVARCRRALADDGCAVLPGFIRPAALAEMAREGAEASPHAHFNQVQTSCYGRGDDPALPEAHPGRVLMDRTNGFVPADRLPSHLAVRRLYHAPELRRFVADCVGVEALHEYGDPLGHLVFNILRPGCQHPWHFDNNDFVVSLLVRAAEAGGRFEYCPGLRSAGDENLSGVAAVLEGDRRPVRTLNLEPGALQLFFGRNALHRVTRVEGGGDRCSLILGYAARPGVVSDPARTRRLFGRTGEVRA